MESFTIPTIVYEFIESVKNQTLKENKKFGEIFENVFRIRLKLQLKK